MTITIRDPKHSKSYRANVTPEWADRHDNGALISCGLTIDEPSPYSGTVWLTRRAFVALQRTGATTEITPEQANHSGCQSRCILRGDSLCQW
jgi:hypothetical protein